MIYHVRTEMRQSLNILSYSWEEYVHTSCYFVLVTDFIWSLSE